MQAYHGNDGVVISLNNAECEDMVSVAEWLLESELPIPIEKAFLFAKDSTFVGVMDAIRELKEEG